MRIFSIQSLRYNSQQAGKHTFECFVDNIMIMISDNENYKVDETDINNKHETV